MNINLKKGFTLIELLVVIAIIGILSSIVLASLNTARGRAKIAAMKSELSSMRAEAEIMYDTGTYGDYDDVCTTTLEPYALFEAAADSVGVNVSSGPTADAECESDPSSWAAAVKLDGSGGGSDWFCVDYTGHADEYNGTSPISTTPFTCN